MVNTTVTGSVLSTKIGDRDLKVLEKLSKTKGFPVEKMLDLAVEGLIEEAFDIIMLKEIEEEEKKNKGKPLKSKPLEQVLKELKIDLAS